MIKVVRALTNLGLKEAKDVVEAAVDDPDRRQQGCGQDAKGKLEAEGAPVEVK